MADFYPVLTLPRPNPPDFDGEFYVMEDLLFLNDQDQGSTHQGQRTMRYVRRPSGAWIPDKDFIYDTSSMCAVVMNTPKGNLFLHSESSTQMFLVGGFNGESFNQW